MGTSMEPSCIIQFEIFTGKSAIYKETENIRSKSSTMHPRSKRVSLYLYPNDSDTVQRGFLFARGGNHNTIAQG